MVRSNGTILGARMVTTKSDVFTLICIENCTLLTWIIGNVVIYSFEETGINNVYI